MVCIDITPATGLLFCCFQVCHLPWFSFLFVSIFPQTGHCNFPTKSKDNLGVCFHVMAVFVFETPLIFFFLCYHPSCSTWEMGHKPERTEKELQPWCGKSEKIEQHSSMKLLGSLCHYYRPAYGTDVKLLAHLQMFIWQLLCYWWCFHYWDCC